eukprot:6172593-Pleurochrysis_carterae.AAC.2
MTREARKVKSAQAMRAGASKHEAYKQSCKLPSASIRCVPTRAQSVTRANKNCTTVQVEGIRGRSRTKMLHGKVTHVGVAGYSRPMMARKPRTKYARTHASVNAYSAV